MVDTSIVNGVCKPTNITGGHHPLWVCPAMRDQQKVLDSLVELMVNHEILGYRNPIPNRGIPYGSI